MEKVKESFSPTGSRRDHSWGKRHSKAYTLFNRDAGAFGASKSFFFVTVCVPWVWVWPEEYFVLFVNEILNNHLPVFVILFKSLKESYVSLLSHVDSCMPSKREFNLPVFKIDRRSSFPLFVTRWFDGVSIINDLIMMCTVHAGQICQGYQAPWLYSVAQV